MSKTQKGARLIIGLILLLSGIAAVVPQIVANRAEAVALPPEPPPPPPPPPPVAGFVGLGTIGEAPLAVQFDDKSSGQISSYLWNFGDGQTSTQQNPSHTYLTEGVYQVTLTVAGPGGATTGHISDYVVVDAGAAPGGLSVRNLRIEPTYAKPNQAVVIYADILNGGGGWGSLNVNLTINGTVEESRPVGVSPGTAYPLSFTVYKGTPGTYTVTIGDATGWFYVVQEQ